MKCWCVVGAPNDRAEHIIISLFHQDLRNWIIDQSNDQWIRENTHTFQLTRELFTIFAIRYAKERFDNIGIG